MKTNNSQLPLNKVHKETEDLLLTHIKNDSQSPCGFLIEKEIEKILTDLDSYGYSREETLKDLSKGFHTEVEEETYFKWRDLKTKLEGYKKAKEEFERFLEDLEEYDTLDGMARIRVEEELLKLKGEKL